MTVERLIELLRAEPPYYDVEVLYPSRGVHGAPIQIGASNIRVEPGQNGSIYISVTDDDQ